MTWRIEDLPWLVEPPKDFRAVCGALDEIPQVRGVDVAHLAGMRLNANQLIRLSDSIRRAREKQADLSPLAALRLGLLGNGTTCLFAPALPAAAARHGVLLEVVQAEYDQVMQEALDPASTMNSCKPDAVLLALDFHGLPFSIGAPGGGGSSAARDYVASIRDGLARGAGAPIIFQTVVCPPAPIFGSLDARQAGTLRRQVLDFNEGLRQLAADHGDYMLDVASLAETVGSQNWQDPVQWNLYKLPFAQAMLPIYAEHVARLLGAIRGNSRKCLVLDLDNTVWGGVIGDDGMNGIVIGQGDPIGEAHLEVQKTALALHERGIILAICSKNTDEIARQPFRDHPEMLLKEEHIAVFQANWSDKASNLEAIARSLNIGLDSLVFLDDNAVERKQVRDALPMVAVPELPSDPSLYARALLNAGYFEAVSFSVEDSKRAEFYQADARRVELASKARNLDDFLVSLGMQLELGPFNSMSIERVTQLINKTNQFNLTTRRYTQSEVETMMEARDTLTLQIRLIDRFGDNGIIGIVIVRQNGDECEVDSWLMSCRVLGRRVEEAVMANLVQHATSRGIRSLIGRYIPTAKNSLVSEHYKKLGFHRAGGSDNDQLWRFNIVDYTAVDLPFEILTSKPKPRRHASLRARTPHAERNT
jgi:FkbH-like protein